MVDKLNFCNQTSSKRVSQPEFDNHKIGEPPVLFITFGSTQELRAPTSCSPHVSKTHATLRPPVPLFRGIFIPPFSQPLASPNFPATSPCHSCVSPSTPPAHVPGRQVETLANSLLLTTPSWPQVQDSTTSPTHLHLLAPRSEAASQQALIGRMV